MMAGNGNRQTAAAFLVVLLLAVGVAAPRAWALKVGDPVSSITLRDAEDEPATIPDFGKKVLAVFYTDPDEKDQNEPFRDFLKAADLDKTRYRGLGVANMKDTWKPNFAIRKVIRDKIKKFKAVILTDPDHILKAAWRLGDCDDKDIVIIIGKDTRVKYIKTGGRMTEAENRAALAIIQAEMAK